MNKLLTNFMILLIGFSLTAYASSKSQLTDTKTNKNSHSWQITYGNNQADEEAKDVVVLPNGDYIVIGIAKKDGFSKALLLKFNKFGKLLRKKVLGKEWERVYLYKMIKTRNGHYFLVGSKETLTKERQAYSLLIDKNLHILKKHLYTEKGHSEILFDITKTRGGYIAVGDIIAFKSRATGIFVLKLNSKGGMIWKTSFYIPKGDIYADTVKTDKKGNIYIAGGLEHWIGAGLNGDMITNGTAAYSMKLNSKGDRKKFVTLKHSMSRTYDMYLFHADYGIEVGRNSTIDRGDDVMIKYALSKSLIDLYGGKNMDVAFNIEKYKNRGFLVAGMTMSYGAGEADMYLLGLTKDGKKLWSKTFGGSKGDAALSVKPTPDGGAILVGGSRSFSGNNSKDIFIVKIPRLKF